ncbi:MAG TPA: acyltransferase [Edaphobacter sp.]|uniref:acyltransferase family protein n=1 Tax=Edaphobacter sp. TaxID=1934404 RepID=UPI002CC2B68A|nr:acyltransferase [Edaphobacter sp.]HUZ94510.1 acyltransferase [Edaphobacter sp.]
MKRIPELDGLRGTAICMVVAHHYIYYKYVSFLGPQWGWAGVDLFFVLSGFLITGILLKSEKNEEGLGHFYMRRVMRLFPIYYLCLAIYFIGNVAAHSPLPWQFLATYSLYLQAIVPHSWLGIEHVKMVDWSTPGFSVMWSLSIEEFFYLVWAPLVFLVRGKDRILFPLLGVVLLGEPFVRFFAYSHHAEELRQMFFARADSLAAGALIAVCMRSYGQQVHAFCQRNYTAMLSSACFLFMAAIGGELLYIGLPNHVSGDLPERTYSALMFTVLWIGFSLILLLCVTHSGSSRRLTRAFRNRGLRYMGTISYCLYLIHFPLRQIMVAHFGRAWGILLGLITSLLLASLSWKYFEGPIARWKEKRFAYKNEEGALLTSK